MTVPEFQDHFSAHAADYARFRPAYPDALFTWLADAVPARDLAWDCGTGNGQAALGLARLFTRVLASDPSTEQLARARPHARVTYRRGGEAASGLASASVDLVTAAQAFHWFTPAAFWNEARRVLKPGGAVAIWCYGLSTIDAQIDPVVRHFHQVAVGPDWPQGRELVDTLYTTVSLPFPEIAAPPFAIARELTLADFLRYVETWSAVQRHRRRTGRDPLPALGDALAGLWGDPDVPRTVRWPIAIRAGRR